MNVEEFDRLVLDRSPEIPWLEPIHITVAGFPPFVPIRRGYACRLCIAKNGRRGSEPLHSKEEILGHIAQTHRAAVERERSE